MKKLQNDFTTPEQSKRLLELSVPADSANCYLFAYNGNYIPLQWHVNMLGENFSKKLKSDTYIYLPCWSVGRLIEIIGICAGMENVDFETLAWAEGTWVGRLIILIENLVKYDKIDFFKLED